jgi:hypothetical protein
MGEGMNCKPGDLAVIVGVASKCGFIVEVMRAATLSRFDLPDGRPHVGCFLEDWIIKFQRAVQCPTMRGMVLSEWAVVADSKLRPVSGLPVDDEIPAEIKEPA